MTVRILDCTLRDGGYYTDWDFDPALVTDYLVAMGGARPDVIEIGFRFTGAARYLGPFAYTPESVLDTLPLPEGIRIAVMINASDFTELDEPVDRVLERLFVPRADSRVDLVRIATTFDDLADAAQLADTLDTLGYAVGLNVMQVATLSGEQLESIAEQAARIEPEVLYVADSTGGLQPSGIAPIVERLRTHWSGPLGLHAHDNMQQALANCLAAVEAGMEWIDGTVLGMGRGPGNARTEHLLLALHDRRATTTDPTRLAACIERWFKPLQLEHQWGSNLFYFLAGQYGIHPTYIQTMLADSRYEAEDILASIDYLCTRAAHRYDQVNLERAGNFYDGEARGTWAPRETIAGRDVLILGSGPGCATHRTALERFIRQRRPVVIALNVNSPIDERLIDLHVACHPVRLLRDAARYAAGDGILVAPLSNLPESVGRALADVECRDFGLALGDGQFAFAETHATLPRPMAAAYALAIANAGGAGRIFMAGFDGYGQEDPRNIEMNQVLSTYFDTASCAVLVALTPTRYAIPGDSVYRLIVESAV